MSASAASTRLRLHLVRLLAAALLVPAGAATGLADVCRDLRAEFSMLPRPALVRQASPDARREVEKLRTQARWNGCTNAGRGFFYARPSPECPRILSRLRQLRANPTGPVPRKAVRLGDPRVEARRAAIQRTMAQRGCAPDPSRRTAEREGRMPLLGSYQSLCVRTCDGYYFPISYSTRRTLLGIEEAACKSMYFGGEAELFVRPVNGRIEDARSLRGERYTRQSYAFLFRQGLNPTCVSQIRQGLAGLAKAMPPAKISVAGKPGAPLPKAAMAAAKKPPAGKAAKAARAKTEVAMPLPVPRIPQVSEDPETLANGLGRFAPAGRVSLADAGMRRLGAAYYYRPPQKQGLFAEWAARRPRPVGLGLIGTAEAAELAAPAGTPPKAVP